MEKTLVVLKPDAVKRSIVGEIIMRFEKAGLKIIGIKMLYPSQEHYHKHYEDISKMISRRGQKAFDVTLEFMMEGPVIAIVLEGVEAVSQVRKMVGTTEPKGAQPGTIRGDYAHMSFKHADDHGIGVPNLIHASGDEDEAEAEIWHWFNDDELYDYQTVHESFIIGKDKKSK